PRSSLVGVVQYSFSVKGSHLEIPIPLYLHFIFCIHSLSSFYHMGFFIPFSRFVHRLFPSFFLSHGFSFQCVGDPNMSVLICCQTRVIEVHTIIIISPQR
ncbi:unnamed protein product, partial [Linum tenue]